MPADSMGELFAHQFGIHRDGLSGSESHQQPGGMAREFSSPLQIELSNRR